MLNKAIWSPDQLWLLLVYISLHFINFLFIYLLETFPLTDIIFYLAILFFGIKSWDTESISGAFLLLAGTMIYRRLQLGSHDRLALTGSRSDGRERWIVFNFLEHLRRIQLQRVLFALEVSSLAFALTHKTNAYFHTVIQYAWERRCIPLTLFHVSSNHILMIISAFFKSIVLSKWLKSVLHIFGNSNVQWVKEWDASVNTNYCQLPIHPPCVYYLFLFNWFTALWRESPEISVIKSDCMEHIQAVNPLACQAC